MLNIKLSEDVLEIIKNFKNEQDIDAEEKQKRNLELLYEDIKLPTDFCDINSFFINFIKPPENEIFINSNYLNEINEINQINTYFNECKTLPGKYLYNYFLKKSDYKTVNLLYQDYQLFNNNKYQKKGNNIIKNYLNYEKNIYNIFFSLNTETIDMYSKLYLFFEKMDYLNKLNNNPDILFSVNFYSLIFSPLLNVLSPLLLFFGTIISVYLIFYRKQKNKYTEIINFIKIFLSTIKTKDFFKFIGYKKIGMFLVSVLVYFYNYISSNYYLFKNVQYHFKIYNFLYQKVNSSINLINDVNDIIYSFGFVHPLFSQFKKKFEPPKIHCNSNKYVYFGDNCVLFKDIYHNKEFLYNGMMMVGYLDLLTTLYKQKIKYNLSFCQFNTNNEISLKECYHPILLNNNKNGKDSNKNLVKNDILINNKIKNICISGPNASGKSIILKTLLINLNYCYSFGFCFSSFSNIPKYDKIFILMNIRDTIGEESFYQAQVNQLNVLINTINDNTHNSNSYLCIMDEVLNSTNYHAATSIIYSLVEYLIQRKNLTTIFATHYFKVTELENIYENIKNYHLEIKENNDKTLNYCYKFTKGKCLINNAFDILKNIDFPHQIIENSINICNNLT